MDRELLDRVEEERPPLGEEGLDVAQVDDRRIDFDLAEIGVDCAVERQVAGHAPLQVDARGREGP